MDRSQTDEGRLIPKGSSFVEAAQSRHGFLVSDRLLLNPERMAPHSDRWVAVYEGEVKAVDESLDGILTRLRSLGVPLASTAIRFIEKDGMAAP